MKSFLFTLVLSLPMFASAQLVKPILECGSDMGTFEKPRKANRSIGVVVNYLPQNKAYVMTVSQFRLDNTIPWPTMIGQTHERADLRKSMHFGDPTIFVGTTYAVSVNLSALPVGGRYPGVIVAIKTGESEKLVCTAK